jgi:hypothetical protein
MAILQQLTDAVTHGRAHNLRVVTHDGPITFPHVFYWSPEQRRALEMLRDRCYPIGSIVQETGLDFEQVRELKHIMAQKPP